MEKVIEFLRSKKSFQKPDTRSERDNSEEFFKKEISEEDREIFDENWDELEKDKFLKIKTCKKFGQKISVEDAFRLINKWGGIPSFKVENNRGKVIKFISKLETQDLTITTDEFSTISSLSKIAFFFDVGKYCIYDSRAIYCLNWALLKYGSDGQKFFPNPNGRNKTVVKYPMAGLLNFIFWEDTDSKYYKVEEAYEKYNDLMKDISCQIFGENAYPFEAERLLFGLVEVVKKDMAESVKILISNF